MDPIKANPGDVNLSVFEARKLREAVKAIHEQPRLSRWELLKLERERDKFMACFDEVAAMMRPLEESYVRARRKLGPKDYDPTEDKALRDVNKAGVDRLEALGKRLEPLHATWQKAVAAQDARSYLSSVFVECLKLVDLVSVSSAIEKGEPPKARPIATNPTEDV
ncbi:hypothetical protein KDW19_15885 [Burkholderia cenocepacia]|uniref:hypothetical protein n=1 Tax=Burkholderia cepacia complex TaxID=87882 RepID=UPI001BA2296E|nr:MULTISPECIES: hypothetical protein [Burkholderia cepacia complex]ELW9448953.1 hypothetical protein [Burkholderia cenocepacia]MBR8483936.1 hypothetical protein [Burkholderia cenocepacia]MDN7471721.1 hypothetical protein [Burkholderia orbicola]MDN7504650.1 hypothetical protein [Burkholderia orbicola]